MSHDLGLPAETLRVYVRRTKADEGKRKDVLTSQEREEIKALRPRVAQLRRANETLKSASVFFAGRARSIPAEVSAFIEQHRERFGVEPICQTLGV
jgi:transposase-like protein